MLLKITRTYLPIFFFLCRQGLIVYPWPRTPVCASLMLGLKCHRVWSSRRNLTLVFQKIFKAGFKKLNTKLENYSGNSSQKENNLGVVLSQV